MTDLTKQLDALLTEAGLPPERELFGKPFAFTYKNRGGEKTRISARITGLQVSGTLVLDFELQTDGMLRINGDLQHPRIRFRGADIGASAGWFISYDYGTDDPKLHKCDIELL